MDPLFDPARFAIPPGVHHLCAGGKSAVPHSAADAVARYLADKSAGPGGDHRQDAETRRLLPRLAALWHVPEGDIGLCASVAEGAAMLAESWDWRDGDNVVCWGGEYPSLAAPFAALPGVALRAGPEPLSLVDGRTRMILASSVSFLDAARADLRALRDAADAAGAALVLDHTQAAGWLRLDGGIADFSFAAGYKWLLGLTGLAVAHWNRARQPRWRPRSAGWHSLPGDWRPDAPALDLPATAMRFSRGNPAHASAYALHAGLDELARHDAAALEAHLLALVSELRERCAARGLPVWVRDPHGASLCLPHPEPARAVAALAARGIWVWGGRGRLRVSVHGYNGSADVTAAAEGLRAAFEGG